MGMTLTSGTLAEDFNYGTPYDPQAVLSAPYFDYSTEEHTNFGIYKSNGYRRRDYSIQYLNPTDYPANTDKAAHGGAHTIAPYYLMFPKMTWKDRQVLTLTVNLTSNGVLTFDRSFDGYHEDVFRLVVNRQEVTSISHTAGHYWVTQSVNLRSGINRISWVMATADFTKPVLRNGIPQPYKTVPKLDRWFRLANISITNVSAVPQPPSAYATAKAVFVSTNPVIVIRRFAKARGIASFGMYEKKKISGPILAPVAFVVTPTVGAFTIRGKASGQVDTTMTGTGILTVNYLSRDAGFMVRSRASLTTLSPIQTVTSLERYLLRVSLTMKTPVILNGRPVSPAYPGASTSTATSSGGYSTAARIDPTSVNHQLPAAADYRWLASDVAGADGTPISSWAEHASGPAWTSSGIYRPTVQSFETYNAVQDKTVSINRVVNFNSRFVQHLWLTMPSGMRMSTPTQFAWQIVGLIYQPSVKTNTIIDAGFPTPDYTNQVLAAEEVFLDNVGHDEIVANSRSYFGIRSGSVEMVGNNTATIITKPIPAFHVVPCVYTLWFNNGVKSGMLIEGNNVKEAYVFSAGQSVVNDFILGRRTNKVSYRYAANMSIFEIAWFNRQLTSKEVHDNSDWLAGVYKFQDFK